MSPDFWEQFRFARHTRRAVTAAPPAPPRPSVPLGEGTALRGDGPPLPGPAFAGLQVHDGTAFAVLRLGGGWVIDITPDGTEWLDLLAHAIGEARDHLTPGDDGKRM